MREVSHEYSVYVGDKENYAAKAQTFLRDNALSVAMEICILLSSLRKRFVHSQVPQLTYHVGTSLKFYVPLTLALCVSVLSSTQSMGLRIFEVG